MTLASTGRVQFRVRAVDRAGNVGAWAYGPGLEPRLLQQSTQSITYRGPWHKVTKSAYSGGSARYATAKGASATYRFTARSVALVTTTGRTRGKVRIYIDGHYIETFDTYSRTTKYRRQIWSRTWPASGTHALRVVVAGTAGRPRVDLDAFGLIRNGASTPAEPDTAGPSLSNLAAEPETIFSGESACGSHTATVSINATDPSGVWLVGLAYAPPGSDHISALMTGDGSGLWTYTITADERWQQGDIDYYVVAWDLLGNQSPNLQALRPIRLSYCLG